MTGYFLEAQTGQAEYLGYQELPALLVIPKERTPIAPTKVHAELEP